MRTNGEEPAMTALMDIPESNVPVLPARMYVPMLNAETKNSATATHDVLGHGVSRPC